MLFERIFDFIEDDLQELIKGVRSIGGYIPENINEIVKEWIKNGVIVEGDIEGDIDGVVVYVIEGTVLSPKIIAIKKDKRNTIAGGKLISKLYKRLLETI